MYYRDGKVERFAVELRGWSQGTIQWGDIQLLHNKTLAVTNNFLLATSHC